LSQRTDEFTGKNNGREDLGDRCIRPWSEMVGKTLMGIRTCFADGAPEPTLRTAAYRLARRDNDKIIWDGDSYLQIRS
jgi:hypothetical protein